MPHSMMRRCCRVGGWMPALVWAALISLGGLAAAAPPPQAVQAGDGLAALDSRTAPAVRVLLPWAGYGPIGGRAEQLRTCGALYLAERLGECPQVAVIASERGTAILRSLQSPALHFPRARLFAETARHLPVDVIIVLGVRPAAAGEGELEVEVLFHSAQGIRQRIVPAPEGAAGTVSAATRAVARAVGEELGLPPQAVDKLTEVRIADDAAFRYHYLTQRLWAPYPANPYGAGLAMLETELAGVRHPAVDAAALRVATGYLTAGRRNQDAAGHAASAAVRALPGVLGTEREVLAHDFARRALVVDPRSPNPLRGRVEQLLLEMVQPLRLEAQADAGGGIQALEELEELVMDGGLDEMPDGPLQSAPSTVSTLTGVTELTRDQRLGAARTLGAMGSRPGLELLRGLAGGNDPALRRAAAVGLVGYAAEETGAALARLAEDADAETAFLARHGRWKQGAEPTGLPARALAMIEQGRCLPEALEVLRELGGQWDLASLRRLAAADGVNPAVGHAARVTLARRTDLDAPTRLALLGDSSEQVILAALAGTAGPDIVGNPRLRERLIALTRDPFSPVAQAARLALEPHGPTDPRERLHWDLAIEHPYLKRRALDLLAEAGDANALSAIEEACADAGPMVRQHALAVLLRLDAGRAHPRLVAALGDPHRWVRLHAAAALAERAAASDALAIETALVHAADPAEQLYLGDALARATGRPLPAPPPAAHSIAGERTLAWNCGVGSDAVNSPFDAYYTFTLQPSPTWKAAHQAGKIFFGRVHPTGDPAQLAMDPAAFDAACQAYDAELTLENLPYVDGVILGEESMSMSADSIWADGWRLFCREAGIDPRRVAGEKANLSESEAVAWRHWSLARWVEGFNLLYDYTKLRFGKLRPGIAVGTFMGVQGAGPIDADLEWKFDLGASYHYIGCNRWNHYALLRRYRTLWPDRPVMWLSHGIGVYERSPIFYHHKPPRSAARHRAHRAYMDSASAYLAGADTGFFSKWAFIDKDTKIRSIADMKGPLLEVEDLVPEHPGLGRAIEFVFRGVEEMYRTQNAMSEAGDQELAAPGEENEEDDLLADFTLDEPQGPDPFAVRVAAEKEALRRGMLHYRRYVYDAARIFASLPRRTGHAPALVVRPGLDLWTSISGDAEVPGADLLPAFDFVLDINKTARLDLGHYRMIAVHDPGRLRDETIGALTHWLRDQPGVLYLHRDLAHDNAFEAGTVADHDGRLERDWLWEQDLAFEANQGAGRAAGPLTLETESGPLELERATVLSTLTVTGAARVLARHEGRPVLAVWRDPAHRGLVVFDGIGACGADYLAFLRGRLQTLWRETGAGLALEGPALHQRLEQEAFAVDVTSRYMRRGQETLVHAGVDVLSGLRDPAVGPQDGAAVLVREYAGRYLAGYGGVSVLCEQPIERVEPVKGGLRVQAAGLIQAMAKGKLRVTPTAGGTLPVAQDVDTFVIESDAEGVAVLPLGEDGAGGSLVFVRSRQPVVMTVVEP